MITIEDISDEDVDNFYKLIGKNVKRIRNANKLTQLQLSQLLGHRSVGLVSQSELYLKKQHFNVKHLYQLSLILDIDICEFFKEI